MGELAYLQEHKIQEDTQAAVEPGCFLLTICSLLLDLACHSWHQCGQASLFLTLWNTDLYPRAY